MKENASPHIRVFAIWEPILPTDYSSPGTAVLGRLSDSRVSQYWDKEHLFATELARRIQADPDQPKPQCCTRKDIPWDEVAVYDQAALWGGQLPRAAYLNGPVVLSTAFADSVARLLQN